MMKLLSSSAASSFLLGLWISAHTVGRSQAWLSSSSQHCPRSLFHSINDNDNNNNGDYYYHCHGDTSCCYQPPSSKGRQIRRLSVELSYSNDETTDDDNTDSSNNSNNNNNNHNPSSPAVERIAISGVSVSPKGFHVLFRTRKGILPLPVTKDPQDTHRATSPEALTILQLLSNVDMAGAVLPPEILAQMAIVQSEQVYYNGDGRKQAKTNGDLLAEYARTVLPEECPSESYTDAHPWFQSRTALPRITLDQALLRYNVETRECACELTCALPKDIMRTATSSNDDEEEEEEDTSPSSSASFRVDVTRELVEHFAFRFNPDTSAIFTTLALALRYRAPILLRIDDDPNPPSSEDLRLLLLRDHYYPPSKLKANFPRRTSLRELRQQSTRISQNIERGMEVHQLMGALKIAEKLGDANATEKIRAKLDEYNSDLDDDLPVVAVERKTKKKEQRNAALPLDHGRDEAEAGFSSAEDTDDDSNAFQ